MAIKNKTRKKSLNDFNFDIIYKRNGDDANDIHANKHQISKENQTT
jgi:hypothetical protein